MTITFSRRFCSFHRSTNSQFAILASIMFPWIIGCQQKMADQPAYRPLEASSFFADGRASRIPPLGTISRTDVLASSQLRHSGRTLDRSESAEATYVDRVPMTLTREELVRGQQRYNIFCAVCHDRLGTGRGTIVERGFTAPPNFHHDNARYLQIRTSRKILLREVPVGYLFEIVSNGFGAMPSYAAQIPVRDRWLIVSYVRALQISQHTDLNDVSTNIRQVVEEQLDRKGDGE